MSGKRNPFRIRKGKETRDMRCVIFVGIERTITDLGTERRCDGPKASPRRPPYH